jgi:cytoskeleton protein RodZ
MSIGSRLRAAREARGLSLEDLWKTTRIKPRTLEAIEKNQADAIPPRPYGRGFVSTYASHVGLDPQQTVRDYFLQFAPPQAEQPELPPPARTSSSSDLWTVGRTRILYAAVAVLALALLARGLLNRDTAPPPATPAATPAAETVGTGGTTEPVAAVARPAALMVELEAIHPVWVTASADGQRTLFRTLRAGERETLRGEREIAIRVGDAGAIRWRVNNRPAELMGARGEVRSARLSPETLDKP